MDTTSDDLRDESQYFLTYKKFKDVININGIGNAFILEFLEFIKEQPDLAIPMLLWIDTFHDFTQLRDIKSLEEYKYDIASINNVLDFYLKKVQNNWASGEKNYKINKQTYTITNNDIDAGIKGKIENKHYSISKCFRDSFFQYQDTKGESMGIEIKLSEKNPKFVFYPFHEDVKYTLLKDCYNWDKKNNEKYENELSYQNRCARILYQISLIIYDESTSFEPLLLYSYILYNFRMYDDKLTYDSISSKLSKAVITSITEEGILPSYAKDVDTKKTSSVFEKTKLVILPSSLFDQNKSNSSNSSKNFVNIYKTTVPFAGYNDFIYEYHNTFPKSCFLKVSTKFIIDPNTIPQDIQIYNSCKGKDKDIFDDSIIVTNNLGIDTTYTIKNFAKYINNDGNFVADSTNNSLSIQNGNQLKDAIEKFVKSIKQKISNKSLIEYAQNDNIENPPSFIYKEGFSVKEINLRIMCEIISRIYQHSGTWEYTYSLLPAYEFDKYMSLKRIGDYAQILQCKQLGIPLITDDNMQILLSIASCSSVIWTPSDKLLYYNGNEDCFVKYDNKKQCQISRNNNLYKQIIDTLLITKTDNTIINVQQKLNDVRPFHEKFEDMKSKEEYKLPLSWYSRQKEEEKEKEKKKILTQQKNKEREEIKMNEMIKTEQKNKERIEYIREQTKGKKITLTFVDNINTLLFSKGYQGTSSLEIKKINKSLQENDSTVPNLSNTFNSINSEDEEMKENDSTVLNLSNIFNSINSEDEEMKEKDNKRQSPEDRITRSAKKQRQNVNQRIKSKYRITQKKKANKYRKNK